MFWLSEYRILARLTKKWPTGAIPDDAEVMVVVEVTGRELQRICADARIPVKDRAVPMCAQLAARSRSIAYAFVVTDNETGVREVAVTGMTRCQRAAGHQGR